MNFTHEQISELMLNIANSENGTNLLIPLCFIDNIQIHIKNHPLVQLNQIPWVSNINAIT